MISDIDALAMFMNADDDEKLNLALLVVEHGPFAYAGDEVLRQIIVFLFNRLGMQLGIGPMPDEHDA